MVYRSAERLYCEVLPYAVHGMLMIDQCVCAVVLNAGSQIAAGQDIAAAG